jgi:hypothetical protein
MSIGDAVIIAPIAFEYVGINTDVYSTGIILNIKSAREYFNLDTDENLCEVLLPDGTMEFFYEIDLKILN